MAKKEEVVPSAKNPVVGSLIKSMFDSSETDPDQKAEDLKAAKESADADAAARKPADDILDEGGANDDEPEPPPRKVTAEPVKPEPEPKPAGEEPPAEPEEPETPRTVPLGDYIDLRQERKQLQDRLKATEDELAKLKTAPPKPKPVDDPEPPKDKILEHDEWEKRELRRQIAASNEKIEEVTKKLSEREQIEQLRDMEERFDVMLEEEHSKYAAKHPEFEDKRSFLRERLIKQATARGATQQQAERMVKGQEREFCGMCVNQGKNFSVEIEKQADAAGYEYYRSWKATQKPNGTNGAAKPAAGSAADRIKAGQRREAAARSTSTAPGVPPVAAEDEQMTAEKFGALTPAQRRAYKRAHPDFDLGHIMGANESSDGLF